MGIVVKASQMLPICNQDWKHKPEFTGFLLEVMSRDQMKQVPQYLSVEGSMALIIK